MAAHAVCGEDDLAVGAMRAFQAGGARIAVYHLADAGMRPRRSARTRSRRSRGKIVDGCQVQCPLHRARFDISTGQVVEWTKFTPGIQLLDVVRGAKPLRTFPVRVKDGRVMVTT